MNKQKIMYLYCIFAAMILLSWTHLAIAQPKPEITFEQVYKLLDQAVPTWNESVLRSQEGKEWAEKLNFEQLLRAVNDDFTLPKEFPPNAQQFIDEKRSVRFDRSRGLFRYISKERAWDFQKNANTKAIDERKAEDIVAGVIKSLDAPVAELVKPRISTQMAAGAPAGEKSLKALYEMYRLVSIQRSISNLPVYGSFIRGSVANDGRLQRLQVVWPAFRTIPDLKLRDRKSVLTEATYQILRQAPEADIKIQAYLAFAQRSEDDENQVYVPSVILSVYSKPTPYQFPVAVAEIKKHAVDERPKAAGGGMY